MKSKVERRSLFNKIFIKVLAEYFNYSNIFLAKNTVEFLENTKIDKHAIKLEKDKQLSFSLISSLRLIKLETLKTYIKTNLANSFIQSSKSLAGVSILFDRKPDKSFCFYLDY